MIRTKSVFNAENAVDRESDHSDEAENSSNLEDDDLCSAQELEQKFAYKYIIADETAISMKKDYVLGLSLDKTSKHLVAGLSNGCAQLFDVNERGLNHSHIECILPPTQPALHGNDPVNICGVQFLKEPGLENSFLIGTTNGLVRLFDMRTKDVVAKFEENSGHTYGGESEQGSYLNQIGPKAITCLDCNANDRIICTGTEQYQNSVFLIFYDVRERKQLGGYYESHQDDVTNVRFHPTNPNLLCSGSTDGLINIYDIRQEKEEDALQTTINTDSSVQKLNWHKDASGKDLMLSCITHTNDFKIYDGTEGDVFADVERQQIMEMAQRKNAANCNLINAHNNEDGSVFLLVGTNFRKGEIFRSLRLQNNKLLPSAEFIGNKQIIRESVYNSTSQCMITAGESGIVSLWMLQTVEHANTGVSDSSQLKVKKKSNKKSAPY